VIKTREAAMTAHVIGEIGIGIGIGDDVAPGPAAPVAAVIVVVGVVKGKRGRGHHPLKMRGQKSRRSWMN